MRTVPIPFGRALCGLALAGIALSVAACGAQLSAAGAGGRVQVVAAENFWASIAGQLGGAHATVTSIIVNPDTDPHAYEPTPADARTIAQAQYVIVNGAGYDPWAPQAVAANPVSGRITLTVADVAARRAGDNPHMWYSPGIVLQVVAHITSDLKSLDPRDAAYFDAQASAFTTQALGRYDSVRATIRSRYAGVPVGATESVFVDLAQDLGLKLITPPEYMRAISEGNDPTTQDKSTFDAQVTDRQIKVLIFNRQNSTPDIRTLVDKANAQGVPVVAITETLDPASATFQDWQADQLVALKSALAKAIGS